MPEVSTGTVALRMCAFAVHLEDTLLYKSIITSVSLSGHGCDTCAQYSGAARGGELLVWALFSCASCQEGFLELFFLLSSDIAMFPIFSKF